MSILNHQLAQANILSTNTPHVCLTPESLVFSVDLSFNYKRTQLQPIRVEDKPHEGAASVGAQSLETYHWPAIPKGDT